MTKPWEAEHESRMEDLFGGSVLGSGAPKADGGLGRGLSPGDRAPKSEGGLRNLEGGAPKSDGGMVGDYALGAEHQIRMEDLLRG